MRITALSCVTMFVCGVALASSPPPIPSSLLPPAVYRTGPVPVTRRPVPRPDPQGPMTLARLKRISVSGVLYGELLREAQANAGLVPLTTTSTSGLSAMQTASRRLHIAADVSVNPSNNANVTSDSAQDVEPTVASVNINGTVHTTTVEIKYAAGPDGVMRSHLWAYHTTNLSSFAPPVELPVPLDSRGTPEYAWTGDPLLSVNPYAGGEAP